MCQNLISINKYANTRFLCVLFNNFPEVVMQRTSLLEESEEKKKLKDA